MRIELLYGYDSMANVTPAPRAMDKSVRQQRSRHELPQPRYQRDLKCGSKTAEVAKRAPAVRPSHASGVACSSHSCPLSPQRCAMPTGSIHRHLTSLPMPTLATHKHGRWMDERCSARKLQQLLAQHRGAHSPACKVRLVACTILKHVHGLCLAS